MKASKFARQYCAYGSLEWLRRRFPKSIGSNRQPPLTKGIEYAILAETGLSLAEIMAALRIHFRMFRYRENVRAGRKRVDLHGNPRSTPYAPTAEILRFPHVRSVPTLQQWLADSAREPAGDVSACIVRYRRTAFSA